MLKDRIMHSLVIHGGAGFIPPNVPDSQRKQYEASLGRALDEGYGLLDRGGDALDAVNVAVRILEDDPLFNSAHGAALTREGAAELDASIMDGRDQRAGSVAGLKRIRNPVDLARAVMDKSRHVMMIGSGAEEFALEIGMPLVSNLYFRTDERRRQLENEQRGTKVSDLVPAPQGTVGAVAFDKQGHLAAATSTGGMTNKRPGRVGDTPIIGAGTYAKNGVCGISCTGHGEYFIRTVASHSIVTAVEYRGLSLEQAMREVLDKIGELGGDGGIIGIDAQGRIVMEFSTPAMFRGARDSQGRREVAMYR
jgi:beta-aspartyl-peptidase (threonine type)